ncbi:biotin holocarboxylase synthetase [Coemansia javaensis]|uniref:Biotin holocarboxylase synthetase n=1 Tax=Coemansia javaensis TaxID=2761396 RepID=A0A9W8HJG0_9FUNG|nr:biotin holocarboxylase synthetase [Coemansia javaensis]
MAALNVLVYSGPGVGLNAHAYLLRTLRQFLSHRYAIIPVGPETLGREPWESKAAMLVVPGGRDLPYAAALGGAINARIKAWVHGGGRYLGFCAGGYYGSARCEFEPGTPLQVVGERELGFFGGTCVGCAYPGYSYTSEDGARAVEVAVERAAFGVAAAAWRDDPERVRVYYNGGGFFLVDELGEADAADVAVLARFPPDVTDPRDRTRLVSGAAAVVSCRAGRGRAVLSGLHPEYAWDFLVPASYTQPHNRGLVSLLRSHDAYRRRLLGAMLAHMGLDVDPEALADCPDQHHSQRAPAATPVYLAPARAAGVADIARTLYALNSAAANQGGAGCAGVGNQVLQDTADDMYVVGAAPGAGQRRVSAEYQDAVLRPEEPPAPPAGQQAYASATVGEARAARRQSLLVLCTHDTLPDADEAPRFSMRAAIEHMRAARAHTAGSWLMYSDTTWSTQTFLEKNLRLQALLPDGTVYVATRQLAGRGRGRNAWISPAGCLQFTMLVRHPELKQAPVVMMQYLAALAVVEAVRALPGYEELPLRLKWPNDIYALLPSAADSDAAADSDPAADRDTPGFAKIGGILVGSSYKSGEFTLLFGCGINVANRLPTTSINSIIREYNSAYGTDLPTLSVERALALITAKFEELYRRFLVHGFKPLLSLYYRSWLHSDQVVTLADRSHEKARVIGLGATDGQLQVRSLSGSGAVYSLQPDGNSFDMLHGMISRKT